MKRLILITLMILATSQSWATLNLAEPEELLKQASISRSSLREVIMDLDLNIPEMRDPETFDKYFDLLDQLNTLAISTRAEEYYPNMVRDLGSNMADNGMRWLDITKDSSGKILYYVRWMRPPVIERFLGLVDYQLDTVVETERLKRAADNLESLIPLVKSISGERSYALIGFRRILSTMAARVLKSPALTLEDKIIWINKVQIASEFFEYVDTLAQQVYSLKENTKSDGHALISILSAIQLRAQSMDTGAPTTLIANIEGLLVETLLRLITFNEPISKEVFQNIINSMSARQIQGLMQSWMSTRHNPSAEYAYSYMQLGGLLITRAQDLELNKEASLMLRWLSQSSVPVIMRIQNLEGQYNMVDNAGEIWSLTLTIARENLVVGVLTNSTRSIQRSFYNVTYDFNTMEILAADRDPDSNSERNTPIRIARDKKGFLWIKDEFALRPESRLFRGHKVQGFSDRFTEKNSIKQKPEGIYEGDLIFPNGERSSFRLSISTLDGYLVGRLEEISNPMFFVDLPIGTSGLDGVVYLLSGRKAATGWLQLRAVLNGDELEVQTLVGGKGLATEKTVLRRINF